MKHEKDIFIPKITFPDNLENVNLEPGNEVRIGEWNSKLVPL